jgi:holin-like protein
VSITSPDVLKMLVDCKLAEIHANLGHGRPADRTGRYGPSPARTDRRSVTLERAPFRVGWPPWRALHIGGAALRVGLTYATQCAVLCGIFLAATALTAAFSLPVPGNLFGMLLLLGLLGGGVVRPSHIQDGSDVLLRHLPLFFIPLNVGVIAWGGLFASRGIALAVSLIGSAVMGIVVAGQIAQWTSTRGGRDEAS